MLLPCAVLLGACGTASAPSHTDSSPDGGSIPTGGGGDGGGTLEAGAGGDGGGGSACTTRRRVTQSRCAEARGASTGPRAAATSASGDTFTYTLTGVTTLVEWKPLLDDTTWAIGPNYHVASGQTVDIWPHFTTMTGTVTTLIADFHSTVLNDDRAIYAYLPASYAENTDATYPVVYMHDGQNLWAALPQLAFSGTWNVDTAFDTASQLGACSSAGVVGWGAQPLGGTATTCTGDSDCGGGRGAPRSPRPSSSASPTTRTASTTTRRPSIPPRPTRAGTGRAAPTSTSRCSSRSSSRPSTACCARGRTSLDRHGGELARGPRHRVRGPEAAGRLRAGSPSSRRRRGGTATSSSPTSRDAPAPARPLVVYVDSGQGTVDDEADTDELAAAYLALGYVDGTNFRHVIQPGAAHNETYWAERFPGAMQLVLGPR
jgi:hypothetical protein